MLMAQVMFTNYKSRMERQLSTVKNGWRRWNTSQMSVQIRRNVVATSTGGWAHQIPHLSSASFFQGHFEGLGYETHILRVFDHGNPAEPESLNVIAWKRGRDTSCVQGMGGHMDIMFPGGPPGGGTYEGAYDNTGGTVSMMLFAKHSLTSKLSAIPSLPYGHLKKKGFVGQMPSQTMSVITAYLRTRNCVFTSTWT